MDGARLSRYPHWSWFRYGTTNSAPVARRLEIRSRGVCHALHLCEAGELSFQLRTGGLETRWHLESGTLSFLPADGQWRTYRVELSPLARSTVLLIPALHLAPVPRTVAAFLRPMFANGDTVLVEALRRMVAGDKRGGVDGAVSDAARKAVLRLTQLNGGGAPDWNDHASVFEHRVLERIVETIDGRLNAVPAAAVIASSVGASPSHFARKFRQSTGLSLERFVNRRRVAAALPLLEGEPVAVATIAKRLGFASQSHFTRVFGGLTGMTPARFRGQFLRR